VQDIDNCITFDTESVLFEEFKVELKGQIIEIEDE